MWEGKVETQFQLVIIDKATKSVSTLLRHFFAFQLLKLYTETAIYADLVKSETHLVGASKVPNKKTLIFNNNEKQIR